MAVLFLAATTWGCSASSPGERGPDEATDASATDTDWAAIDSDGATDAASPAPDAPAPAPPPPVSGAPAYCPAVEEQLPPEECAALTQVQTGSGALKTPAQMLIGQPEVVTLALSREAGSSAPSDAVAGAPGVERPLAPAVGRWMEATLIPGPGLKASISPETPALQDLFASEDAYWQWTVEATEPGQRQLTLRTRVMVKGADGEFRPRGRGFTRQYPIDVAVSRREGVIRDLEKAGKDAGRVAETGGGWEKLFYALAALVIALGAVWAAIRGFGKTKSADKTNGGKSDDKKGG
ncbi:hypothetical protein L6Q21_02790 [Sandaracinobacter sp. RS1-74]|uniref:hypothetical protein n=1 Tax=Sandaracinobacteroides sayramensis TaxID=2913411 RepID=UPI001EDB5741|nr:hypothetical protein [Sandaracinobacteroides sayramensis]MCG2839909.1 hypothetical protein [Sandaracinobacteroides sayramensis]